MVRKGSVGPTLNPSSPEGFLAYVGTEVMVDKRDILCYTILVTLTYNGGIHMLKKTMLASAILIALTACASTDTGDGAKAGKPGKPDVKVQATQIMKQFTDNEAAADGKYKGKTIQVTGVVDKIDTELMDDEQYVIRIGGGSDFELFTVNCDDQSSKTVAKMKKGQKITVVGDFEDGGDLGVELENCAVK